MGKLIRISDAVGPRTFGTGPRTERTPEPVQTAPVIPKVDLPGLGRDALRSGTLPMTTAAGRVALPTGAERSRELQRRTAMEAEQRQLTMPGKVYNAEQTARNQARLQELDRELSMLAPKEEGGRFKSGVQSILSSAVGAIPAIAATVKSLDWSIGDERNREESRQLAELDRKLRALEAGRQGEALDYIRSTDEWKALDAQRRALSLQANPAVNMDDPGMRLMRESNQYREQALEGLEGVPRFLGGTALSIGQNAALLPLAAVNPALPLAAMGTISAADRMYELGERGLPASEALSRGLISGGIEAATEKIPLDTLLDVMRSGGKGALRSILRQAGTEAGEEAVSYLANYLVDKAYKDPEAEFSLAELAQAAAGGALSGGVFGGFGSAYNAIGERLNRPVALPVAERADSSPAAQNDGGMVMPPVAERAQGQKNSASTGETGRRMAMEDFISVDSPVWNNVPYEDTGTQHQIMRRVHQKMVDDGAVVEVPESTMERVRQSYPDLRGMKKTERTPILRQKMKELKESLRQFLNGLKNGSYEFEVDGNILEARLYDTGIREVMEKISQGKASMLYHSDQVFRRARYLYSTPDYDGDPNIYRWNYFYTPVRIGDEIVGVRIAVRDMATPKESQIYNWGIKKGAALDGGELDNMPDRSDVSSTAPDGAALDGGGRGQARISPDVSSAYPSVLNIPQQSAENNPTQADTLPIFVHRQTQGPVDLPIAGENGGPKEGTGGFGPNTVGSAESQFHSAPRVSRVERNTFERGGIYNDVNRGMAQAKPEDLTYDPISEQQSMSNALSRLMNDFDGERADLPNKEAWSGEDLDTAMGILYQARQTGKRAGDYSEFNRWRKLIQEKGTNAGQMIQAFAKYTRTVDGILVEAANSLDDSRLSEARKAEILDQVQQQAQELEDIQGGDKQSVINLIKQNSNIRQTGTLFRNRISGPLDKALQADSFDHLRQVAAAQIDNIAKDHQRQSAAGRVRDLRSMFMLSNVATTLRNLVGNTVFGGLDSFAGNTGGVPLDILLSRFTGTRSVAAENPLSAAVRNGMADGAMKSYIEVALDADPSGAESRYGTTSNRSFKMTGSPLERFLSTWSKYMGYALNTTDEMAKGGVRAGVQEGIDRLTERSLVSDDSLEGRADEMARYRTFQDDTALSKGMRGVRNALNHAGVGPAKGGSPHSLGAGDVLMPFDRVPANLVSRALEYSPFGLAKGTAELAQVLNKAHNGTLTAAEQARAVSDVSRGMTGTGLIAAFAAMAASGLLRVAGNEEGEEDKTSLETSEGLSGTQLNLSGLLRWIEDGNLPKMLPGGKAPDPVAWRKGDIIMSIGFLDPINAQMTTGALLAQELQEGQDAGRSKIFLKASLEGTLQSVLDLPAMSSLKDLANGYSYSDAETTGGKVLDALTSYGASQVSSFVPNVVRAAARGGDPYVRDAYSSGSTLGEMVDNVKMGIPGLRQTLPIRQTPFGEDRTYGDDRAMNALNALLLPGTINTYRPTEASQEIHMLPTVDDNPIYPRRNAPNKVSFDGMDYELTAGQKTQYQKTYGQTYRQLIDALRVSSYYNGLEPEDQTRLLSDARAYANDKAKREALRSSGVEYKSSSWEKAYQAELAGVPSDVFLAYRAMRNELEDSADKETARNANAIIRKEIMNDSSLTPKQKSTLDQYLINDITIIPKDMEVDYSNWEKFSITQMSDSAQKKWPAAEDWGMSPEEYEKYYPICAASGNGMTKDIIIQNLMDAGMSASQAKDFWRLIRVDKY